MLNSCLPEGKAVPAPLEAPVKYVKYLCCVQMYQNGEGKRTLSKYLTSVADFVHDRKFQFVAYVFNVFCSQILQTMFGSSDLIFIA